MRIIFARRVTASGLSWLKQLQLQVYFIIHFRNVLQKSTISPCCLKLTAHIVCLTTLTASLLPIEHLHLDHLSLPEVITLHSLMSITSTSPTSSSAIHKRISFRCTIIANGSGIHRNSDAHQTGIFHLGTSASFTSCFSGVEEFDLEHLALSIVSSVFDTYSGKNSRADLKDLELVDQ
jgi:hypothetical protein